jgi:rhodanese-related sulfurtransferase
MMKSLMTIVCLLGLLLHKTAQAQETVQVADFKKAISDTGTQLLDVRTIAEYNSGHIDRSLQADWLQKDQFAERVRYLDKDKPLYVYCLSGGRSAQAATWLREHGFTRVTNLQGGINAWRQANEPLAGTAAVPQLTDEQYQALVNKGKVLVDFGAAWCPPCKKMEPVLAAFQAKHPELNLVKIDAGVQTGLVKKNGITALPVFLFYVNGQLQRRKEGAATGEELEQLIQ